MSQEGLFRFVTQADGSVVFEQVPLTREALLNPQIDEQLSQSRPHALVLTELTVLLTHFFEEQGAELSVYSKLFVRLEHLGERNVVPDLFVAKGVDKPSAIFDVFDPVKLGVVTSFLRLPRSLRPWLRVAGSPCGRGYGRQRRRPH